MKNGIRSRKNDSSDYELSFDSFTGNGVSFNPERLKRQVLELRSNKIMSKSILVGRLIEIYSSATCQLINMKLCIYEIFVKLFKVIACIQCKVGAIAIKAIAKYNVSNKPILL